MTTATATTITEKIGRLLAQAENTSHEAEAEIFFAKAQELATLYSVDLAKARHATELKERTVPTTRRVTLGERGTRGLNTLVELITEIGGANGLVSDIAHNSTYVNLFGFAEDIDVTEALYASLSIQMVHAAEEHKRSGDWKEDLVYREGRVSDATGRWISGGYKPVSWVTARLDFQQAFAVRVGSRLKAAKRDAELALIFAEQEAEDRRNARVHLDADGELTIEFMVWFYDENNFCDLLDGSRHSKDLVAMLTKDLDNDWVKGKVTLYRRTLTEQPELSSSTSLVLADKAAEVKDYYTATSNARGSYRGGRDGFVTNVASSAGYAAGSSARLSGQGSISGGKAALR